ncbi:hypothetical protein V8C43DRAFT_280226 [Trichoderma afarasin]
MLLLLHLFRLLRFFVVFCKCLTLCLSRGQWRGKTAKEEQQAALRVSSRRLSPWLPGKNSLASPASKKAQHTSMTPLSLNGRYKYMAAIPRTGEAFFSSSLVVFFAALDGAGVGQLLGWADQSEATTRNATAVLVRVSGTCS